MTGTAHVLVLTPFYPTAADPTQGCFISEPLMLMPGLHVRCSVVAVRAFYQGAVRADPGSPPASWIRYLSFPGNLGLATAGRFLKPQLGPIARRLNAQGRIDLIHAHGPLPCGHAAALLSRELRIPFVVSVHGRDAFNMHQAKGLAGLWCARTSAFVYRCARRVICVSGKVEEEIRRVLGSSIEIRVVYNGVNPEMFSPGLDTGADGPVILSVGNLIAIKGHDLVIRAVADIARRHPNLRYEIIGDGPKRSFLARLAGELGISDRVRFLGRRSRLDVVEAFRRCSVFALPSCYEALGCVFLEAMAAAKPVIACKGQGIEEIIRHGENGWLLSRNDVPTLREALEGLLADSLLRERLGQAGRRTVLEGYTHAHQAERLRKVYEECLG